MHYYEAYGLNISSEITCPELVETSEHEPDVIIQCGIVPQKLAGLTTTGYKFQAGPNRILIQTMILADILVAAGREITVAPKSAALDGDVRLVLLGWALGALLHQRDLLPLHGSVISLEGGGCVVFCAPSGTGKSTPAASFLRQGYQLMDDNIAVVAPVDEKFMVYPGYPEIKLWPQVFKEFSQGSLKYRTVRPSYGKQAIDDGDQFQNRPQPLKKIYIISRTRLPELKITPLAGGDKFQALLQNTFCVRFVRGLGKIATHLNAVQALAAAIPVLEIQVPEHLLLDQDLIEFLEQDFQA
ncbi:MAG: hypothetical protein HQK59_18280 [Deltaproteobacteria bacterium]|nr:hypothetical protein [Deltaproteobacteria bacterium]